MSNSIGTNEAARRLGITPATLYAYVSRGRISRRTAADGRSSLFALADVEALAARSRRAPQNPRPTIDVRVASTITTLSEDGVMIRGHDLAALVREHSFEAITELLLTGTLADTRVDTVWPASPDRAALGSIPHGDPLTRLAIAAHLLGDLHHGDPPAEAARRLLIAAPVVFGARRRTGTLAVRLASAWTRSSSPALVSAIDAALGLLADHELATSTLAVRVAASVRTPPLAAFAAGLAAVSGPLHGRAAAEVHRFLDTCAADGVAVTVADFRARRQHVPGFGHKVYRGPDPRFAVLLERVRLLGDLSLVDEVLAEVGRVVPQSPNIDMALGALTWRAGFPASTPIFGVARIAGWAAHYAEELDAPPVRYRGITA